MKKLDFSNYNLLCVNQTGQYIIYNTLTEGIMEFDKDTYKLFMSKNKNDLEGIDDKLVNRWIDEGFIVENKEQQINKVEYEYGNLVYGDEELQLTILTTNACNFDCVYCYQKHLNSFMNSDTQNRILQFLRIKLSAGFKRLYISWFGGEPLLTADMVIKMSRQIKEIARNNHAAYMGQMTTNGYELDLDTFEKLVSTNILYYSITIDGTSQIHNTQRPHKVRGNSYEKIMNNLCEISRNVKTNRFIIDIRVNLSKAGIRDFMLFANEFKLHFGNDKRFHLIPEPIKDWGGVEKIEIDKYTIKQIRNVYDVYEILENMNIDVSNFYNFQRMNHICVAPIKNGYVIDWDGKVHKCDMDIFRREYYDKNVIGQISENGYLDIDMQKNADIVVRNCFKYNCQECLLYPKCMGVHCVHAIKMMESDVCLIKDELLEFATMAAKIKFMRRGRKDDR